MEKNLATIVIVDDEVDVLEFLKYNLEKEGFNVHTASNGIEGKKLAKKVKPDLIILDVMMPGRNGFEVCSQLRFKKIDIPVLMLTAKDEIEDRVKGLDSGADDYLIKPFDFSELLARVRAILRRKGKSRSPELEIGGLVGFRIGRVERGHALSGP